MSDSNILTSIIEGVIEDVAKRKIPTSQLKEQLENAPKLRNAYDALNDADALLIATEWSVFRNPDFEVLAQKLKNKIVFDGRNLYDLQKMIDLGFYYNSIGRKLIN
mgnify:CR=1 FL=1